MNKTIIKIAFVTLACLLSGTVRAQIEGAVGTYSPYSQFGLGDIAKSGSAYNAGMGGIGTGLRDNRFINYMNPASITERDTLSFMLDFGIFENNVYSRDSKVSSAYNVVNINNFVLTTPIYKKSALIIGVAPYSNVGYTFKSFETDPDLVTQLGDIKYTKYGTGSMNQIFLGAAMDFFKDFSIGAQVVYYFGSINRYSNIDFTTDPSNNSLITNRSYSVGAVSGNFGLQYSKDFKNDYNLTVGVSYRMGTTLGGDYRETAYSGNSSSADTLYNTAVSARIYIPDEYSAGFSFGKKDKWKAGFDYIRQNWSKSSFFETLGVDFSTRASQSFRAGVEFIPNRYDIRYYMRRCTYRFGVYYDQTYMKIGKYGVDAAGITFGMSFPVFRFYNAINFSIDVGQRGNLRNNLVRENYIKFQLNFSLHDIWFLKPKYE